MLRATEIQSVWPTLFCAIDADTCAVTHFR